MVDYKDEITTNIHPTLSCKVEITTNITPHARLYVR